MTGPDLGAGHFQRHAALVVTLVVAKIFEVRVKDIVISARGLWLCISFVFLLRLVDRFAQLHGSFCHVLDASLDLVGVLAFQIVLQRVL